MANLTECERSAVIALVAANLLAISRHVEKFECCKDLDGSKLDMVRS